MNVVHASAPENANSLEKSARDVVSFLSLATRVLFVNGETTRRMILGLERLGRALGVNVTVSARWGEVVLRIDDPAVRACIGSPRRPSASTCKRLRRLTT
jgi:hypothetical protein